VTDNAVRKTYEVENLFSKLRLWLSPKRHGANQTWQAGGLADGTSLPQNHQGARINRDRFLLATTAKKMHAQVAAAQVGDIISVLLAFRFVNAISLRTFFQPDEYFQALEPAWKIAFGSQSGAWMTWVILNLSSFSQICLREQVNFFDR